MAKFTLSFLLTLFLIIVTDGSFLGTNSETLFTIDESLPEKPVQKLDGETPPVNQHGRSRRAATCGTETKLHPVQVKESIVAHNHFRSQEKAANMHALTWSDELAAVAQAWADKCQWGHGMLYDCSGDRMGQNLFVEASIMGYPALNMTGVCAAWAGEVKDWNFATGQCNPGKICGHWSQLVGAISGEVGCAFAECPTLKVGTQMWTNALLVVCDYYLPGNQQGTPVYQSGTPCSNCDAGKTGAGFRCKNNLCERCYPNSDSTCKCGQPLMCEHGGKWNSGTCSCDCTKGYYGVGCEHTCTCEDLTADSCVYWFDYCQVEDYSDFMAENCKKTCDYPCSLPPSCV